MSERLDLLIARESHLDSVDIETFGAIYVDSFPASERGDFGELVQDIAQGTRWLFTARAGDDMLLGFAVILPTIAPRIHMLEYLAVRNDRRSQGLGSRFLKEISGHLRSDASGILFEVESPEEVTGEEEKLRRRRIGFYLRNGARMVECAPRYRAPNLAGPGTLSMRLMWLALDSAPVPTGALLADCLVSIYIKSYAMSAHDPLVQMGLRELAC